MARWRRRTGWIALAAALVYALAPLMAAARPLSVPGPAQCAAKPDAHTCACRPDPHGAEECCCKPKAAEGACRLNALPCDSGAADAVQALWTFANPLPEPTPEELRTPSPTPSITPASGRFALRVLAGPTRTPPPQARSAS